MGVWTQSRSRVSKIITNGSWKLSMWLYCSSILFHNLIMNLSYMLNSNIQYDTTVEDFVVNPSGKTIG